MERRRAESGETPAYPSAGEVRANRREFLAMVAKIGAGAAVLGPAAALALEPDEPVPKPGQAPVVPAEPPPKINGGIRPPDPPRTRGVPKPPDPPTGDPPPVGCPPDSPPATGGEPPMPEPPLLDGVIVPPKEP